MAEPSTRPRAVKSCLQNVPPSLQAATSARALT